MIVKLIASGAKCEATRGFRFSV